MALEGYRCFVLMYRDLGGVGCLGLEMARGFGRHLVRVRARVLAEVRLRRAGCNRFRGLGFRV